MGIEEYQGYGSSENVIEWIKGSKYAGCSLSQGWAISRVRKLAEKCPEECQISAENDDGTIYAKMPVKWAVKLTAARKASEKQKQAAAERLTEYHQSKKS